MLAPRIAVAAAVLAALRPAVADEPPQPPAAPERATSLEPKPAQPPPPGPVRFEADPITDGAVVAASLGFAGLLELIDSTGEIHPQQIARTFQTDDLLFFDRVAVNQTIDTNAGTFSNLGAAVALGFAALDPILTGTREGSVQSGLVDAIIYAESISVAFAATDLAKIAVRRPRPIAYVNAQAHKDDPNYMNFETDSALSFFSGHTSLCAAVTASATYLAFARAPKGSLRPWLTLAGGVALTTFVGTERVRSGAHFPSDVIAGALAGAGIGVLVPHFHRAETTKERPLWIGFARDAAGGDGGVLTLGGTLW